MTRATFAGLDLSGDPWRYCVAAVDDAEVFSEHHCEDVPAETAPFWSQAERLLDAANLKPLSTAVLDRHLGNFLPQAQELAKATGQIAALGMATPYCIAPAIRQRLATLRFGLSGVPPQMWEAPLVAALDLIATESLSETGGLLLFTPAPPGAELAAVQWEAEGGTLVLTTTAVREFSLEPATLAAQWEGCPAALRAQLRQPAGPLRVFGEGLAAAGQELAGYLATSAAVLPAQRIAAGAARAAALASRRTLYGTPWEEVKVQSSVARPIGVIGVNGAGQQYWRLLFDAGTPYSPPPTFDLAVRAATSPDHVLLQLADAHCPGGSVPQWLSQADADAWQAAGLRLYAQRHLPPAAKQQSGTLQIKLKNAPRASLTNDDLVGLTWTSGAISDR